MVKTTKSKTNLFRLFKNGEELGTTRAEYAFNAKDKFIDKIPDAVWKKLKATESGYLADDKGDIWEIR